MFIQMKKHFCLQFLLFVFLPRCLQANEASLECKIAMDVQKVGEFLNCTDEERSQGNTGTCVAFALTRVAEHFYNKMHPNQGKKTFNEYYFAKRAYYSRVFEAIATDHESLKKWKSYNDKIKILGNQNIEKSEALDLFELLHVFNHSGFVVEDQKSSRLIIESMKIIDPRFYKEATKKMLIAGYNTFQPEKSSFEIFLDTIYVSEINEVESTVRQITKKGVDHITGQIEDWSGDEKVKHYFFESNQIMSSDVNTVSKDISKEVKSFSDILDKGNNNKAYIVLTTDQDDNAHAIVFLGKRDDKYLFKNSWKDQPELSLTKNQVDGLFSYDKGGSDAIIPGKFEKIYAMYELSAKFKN